METDMEFDVLWLDDIVSHVKVGPGKDVMIDRFVIHPLKQIFCKDRMTKYELGEVMRLRCVDENRADIKEYLEYIGLREYDIWKILRATHGAMSQDFIWIRFSGERLTAGDIFGRRMPRD